MDARLARVESIRSEIARGPRALNVEDAKERWSFQLQKDERTIRSYLRTICGETIDGERVFFTRMRAGKRFIGTMRTFRNLERDTYNGVLEAYGGDE